MARATSKRSNKGGEAKGSSVPRKKGGVRKPQRHKSTARKTRKTFKSSTLKKPAPAAAETEGDSSREQQVERKRKNPSHSHEKTLPKKRKIIQNKKVRRVYRRSQRKGYTLSSDAKLYWERLRRHDLEAEDKTELLDHIMTSITGHMRELAVKHDTARIVQCCLKLGSREQRTAVFNELREHTVELSKLKYAKFTVKALLKYCTPSERAAIISSLYGNVCKLLRHTEAAEIVEVAYNEYANASQRSDLVQEFYGPLYTVFKDQQLSSSPCGLGELLANYPEKRESVLTHLKTTLLPLLDKSVVTHSIIHRAMLDYFMNCGDGNLRSEMIEAVRDCLVSILHTKEGSKVTLQCLWHGTTKDRKCIIKSFKSFVTKICKEENGHLVMLAVFDCVDDTVLVKKALITEMVSHLEELCDDPYGRRVLLYLLAPRSPRHFSPQFVTLLTPGDGNKTSKKSSDVRYRELVGGVVNPLVQLTSRVACEWARSKQHAPLLVEIAESATGDVLPLYKPLLDEISLTFDPSSESHLVAHPCGHWVMKRLIGGERGTPSATNEGRGGASFAEMLLERVSTNEIQSWVKTNRGSFVVCGLLQCGASVREKTAGMLTPWEEVLGDREEVKGQQAIWNELHKSCLT